MINELERAYDDVDGGGLVRRLRPTQSQEESKIERENWESWEREMWAD